MQPKIVYAFQNIEENWKFGNCQSNKILCRSEQSKGVYCLQYDDEKIVSGLRDNTIKVWDRKTLECIRVLQGHTGSVAVFGLLFKNPYLETGAKLEPLLPFLIAAHW